MRGYGKDEIKYRQFFRKGLFPLSLLLENISSARHAQPAAALFTGGKKSRTGDLFAQEATNKVSSDDLLVRNVIMNRVKSELEIILWTISTSRLFCRRSYNRRESKNYFHLDRNIFETIIRIQLHL